MLRQLKRLFARRQCPHDGRLPHARHVLRTANVLPPKLYAVLWLRCANGLPGMLVDECEASNAASLSPRTGPCQSRSAFFLVCPDAAVIHFHGCVCSICAMEKRDGTAAAMASATSMGPAVGAAGAEAAMLATDKRACNKGRGDLVPQVCLVVMTNATAVCNYSCCAQCKIVGYLLMRVLSECRLQPAR